MLAMPLFFALMSLVVDGGNILVHKRNIQVATDAAALAVAQNVDLSTSTCGTYKGQTGNAACNALAAEYSSKNGVNSSIHKCNDADPAHPTDTNCWAYPYVDKSGASHNDEVEVRLRAHVTTFIAGVIGLYGADVSARAVASTVPVTATTTSPDSTIHGTTQIIPGGTHTTTDPSTDIGNGGIAYTLSRRCDAIDYGGNPKSALPLGAFATNGGLQFRGNGNLKKITTLYYNRPGCPNNPKSPPSGTSQCTAIAWGDASNSDNTCVKTLVDLNASATLPINWPLAPPTPPTPEATAFNPSTDYPSKCTSLGISGTITFTTSGHPPGIYCVSGATTTLVISTGADLTTGDGYTFFALDGAKITYNSNGSKLQFYWPSACGPRPTTRPASFTCFGRTISGYDPQTVFYATNTTYDFNVCENNAICLAGQNNQLTGDGFAPKPDDFPPGPTETGGTVFIAGGALASGSGFFESWMLEIQGNTGSYSGTGVPIAIVPGGTHTTTDPSTTIITPDTIVSGTVGTTTIGNTIGLGE